MSANFKIHCKESNGNLHIKLQGDFDGGSAWELINLIHEKYDGCGRVYIDTERLGHVHPFGSSVFRRRLNPIWVPTNRLFLQGAKRFDIAPLGGRVIMIPGGRSMGSGASQAYRLPGAKKEMSS